MEHAYPELKEFSRQRYGLEFQVRVHYLWIVDATICNYWH
jgi:hypothetical protein